MDLMAWQRRFVRAAARPGVDLAALSVPRGNGKSTLAARMLADRLSKHDGAECVMLAGSVVQARIPFRMVRAALGEDGWVWSDSANRLGGRHQASRTRLTVLSSNPKTAQGWQNIALAVADEPGAWEVNAGGDMFDAISTACGKPESPLKAVMIGTRAPASRGWWIDLLRAGSTGPIHVHDLQCDDLDRWADPAMIRRCNPLMWRYPASRRRLLFERDQARRDSRLKARFLSFRLNVPAGDEARSLLTVPEWLEVCRRPAPERDGRPVAGVDLGGGRAWSAAVAWWPNGRIEAVAVAPGVPALGEQERRDGVPRGTYQALAAGGALRIADGLHVPPAAMLVDAMRDWNPASITCDRFRLADLSDAGPPCRLEPRVSRWSESSADIRALRRAALDGALAAAPCSRDLLTASLAVAEVKTDDAGNIRLVKAGANNQSRDDVAAALVLAAGADERRPKAREVVLHIA